MTSLPSLDAFGFRISFDTLPLAMALSETFVKIHQTRTDKRGVTVEKKEDMSRGQSQGKDQTMSSPNRCYHDAPLGTKSSRYIQNKKEEKKK